MAHLKIYIYIFYCNMFLPLKVITRLLKVATCSNKRYIIVQYKQIKRTSSTCKAALY